MPQPKKRMTSTRSGNRRSQDHLKQIILVNCAKCKSPVKPHQVCTVCGYYKDDKVLDVDKKKKLAENVEKIEENK